jgi:O-glycosyl hydrolase
VAVVPTALRDRAAVTQRWNALRAPVATALVLVAGGLSVAVSQSHPAYAASAATINGSTAYQTISGFGASEAFGEASTVMNATSAVQKQVLDLLFSPTAGAGLTILRNEVPSDSGGTIEPTAPSSPTAAPAYRALGNDEGQEWITKQAQAYGVDQFFADAWGAPAFMKTNNSDDNGGTLCGVPGATCSSGDWRQAYANYLVQYAQDYAADGVNLNYLGFENEANLAPSYSGMVLTPAQTANFADVLGPTLSSSGLSTQLECCAAEGWDYAASYTSAIGSDPVANSYVKLITSHGYTSPPTSQLASNGKPVWETEWSTFDGWNPAWDDGSDASGFTWAQHIYTGLTAANLGGFLYWWGSTTPSENGDNEGLLEINGSTVTPSGRLWAFANYSRYIHPGATRIGATTADGNLDLTAFKNTDGTVAVVALNTSGAADSVAYSLQNTGITAGTATPYVTNASSNAAAQSGIAVSGGAFTASVPARSLVTYLIMPGSGTTSSATPSPSTSTSPSPSASPSSSPSASTSPSSSASPSPPASPCKVTYTKSSEWAGGFVANVTLANTGTATDTAWTLKFTFPGDQKVTNAWNTTLSQSGEAVTATNLSYNATIAPGGSTSIGFQGTWTSSDAAPTAFSLNGNACSTG